MHKTHKLFKQSAKLFEKYQIFVHNESPDDCDEESYYDFLVKSPLKVQYYAFTLLFMKY